MPSIYIVPYLIPSKPESWRNTMTITGERREGGGGHRNWERKEGEWKGLYSYWNTEQRYQQLASIYSEKQKDNSGFEGLADDFIMVCGESTVITPAVGITTIVWSGQDTKKTVETMALIGSFTTIS